MPLRRCCHVDTAHHVSAWCAQRIVVEELIKLGDTTPGGLPRYKEWLAALRAYYEKAGAKVHEANWYVDAGYIGRTIQLFKDRLSGHKNKPQLTYTILDHCQKIRKKSGGRIAMPQCFRWVRRRPLSQPPATPLSLSAGSVQLHPRLGRHDRRARGPVRPDRGPSDQRVRVLGAVRARRSSPRRVRASVCPSPRRRLPRADALLSATQRAGADVGTAGYSTAA